MNYLKELERLRDIMAVIESNGNPWRNEEWNMARRGREKLVHSAILEIFQKVTDNRNLFEGVSLRYGWARLYNHYVPSKADEILTSIGITEKAWAGEVIADKLMLYGDEGMLENGTQYLSLDIIPKVFERVHHLIVLKSDLANPDDVIARMAASRRRIIEREIGCLIQRIKENEQRIAKCDELVKKGKQK